MTSNDRWRIKVDTAGRGMLELHTMRILPPALFALVVLSAAPIRADDSDIALQLDYARGPGAESCPDEHAVRHFLIGEFGYDPVQAEAGMTLKISITRPGPTLRVVLRLEDAGGNSLWDDGFDEASCMTLIRHSALKAKININYLLRQPSTPPPPAPVPPQAAPLPPTHSHRPASALRRSDPTPLPPSEGLRFNVGLHALGQVGITPSVSLGGAVSVEAVYRHYGLGVEARLASSVVPANLELPGQYRIDETFGLTYVREEPVPVHAVFAAITVAPCYHRGPFVGCAVMDIGTLRSFVPGGPVLTHAPRVLAFGVRPAFQLPLAGWLAFRASAEVSGIITTTTLRYETGDIWKTPRIFGTLAVGVIGTFHLPVGKEKKPAK